MPRWRHFVHYVIQPGETPEQNGQPRSFYSRIDERNNEMILLTYRPEDDISMTPSWPRVDLVFDLICWPIDLSTMSHCPVIHWPSKQRSVTYDTSRDQLQLFSCDVWTWIWVWVWCYLFTYLLSLKCVGHKIFFSFVRMKKATIMYMSHQTTGTHSSTFSNFLKICLCALCIITPQ